MFTTSNSTAAFDNQEKPISNTSLNYEVFRDQWEDMIRDRLVCGVNDERIQRRLLAGSLLDFIKALELATAMEIADKNTRDLQQSNLVEKPKEAPVNRLSK